MSITTDTFGYIPQTAAEFTALLTGTGIANPDSLYRCQESSSSLADSIGSNTLIASGTPTYRNSVSGATTKAVICRASQSDLFKVTGLSDGVSMMAFAWISFPATNNAAAPASVLTFGNTFSKQPALNLYPSSSPTLLLLDDHGGAVGGGSGGTSTSGVVSVASAIHPVILQSNFTSATNVVQSDLETITHSRNAADVVSAFALGGDNINYWQSGGCGFLYVALWIGVNSELDAGHCATLLSRMTTGIPVVSGLHIGLRQND